MLRIFSNLWKSDTPRSHVTGFYESMKPIHDALCRQWYLNLAMQRGGAGQWASYATNSTNILSVPAAPSWRKRVTYNKLLPLSIVQRHKLLPSNPTINTIPANPISETDKKNADTARALLRATWAETDFQDELNEMALWMVPCTMGYLLTLWDGEAGTELAPGIHIGEQIFEAAPPFEIIPDYSVSRFKDVMRFLWVKVRSLDYIEQKYGKKVKAQKISMGSVMQIKAQALATGAQLDIEKILDNHALVMNMYELPSRKYPEGFHHICTEDEDLIEQETLHPYFVRNDDARNYFLPWNYAQMIRLAGALIGTNSVEQATPPQCHYNQGKSLILENQARLGRPKIVAEEESIAKGAMVEDPAEIIIEVAKDASFQPYTLKPPEMAQYQIDNINKLPGEIQDAFGLHDATMGVLPRRATSGKAIGFLADQDDERHFDPKAEIDRAVAGAFRKALNIRANCYTETRIKNLIGDEGNAIRRELKGEDLRNVDVTIIRDTALPKEAGARMELAMEILDKKVTKEQMEIVFAIMQAKNIEDLKAILRGATEAEEIYARMESFDMKKGIWRPVSPGENHPLHEKIHDETIKNPNTSPDAKILIMRHNQEHHIQAGAEAAARAAGELGPEAVSPEEGQEIIPPAGGEVVPVPGGFAGPGAPPRDLGQPR